MDDDSLRRSPFPSGKSECRTPARTARFPHKVRKYVLEDEVVDLPTAIRSMTSLPADVFRMSDRGRLREGAVADVVVFDLARLRDRATYTDPHQLSEGMVHVFVNGEAADFATGSSRERWQGTYCGANSGIERRSRVRGSTLVCRVSATRPQDNEQKRGPVTE